MGLAAALGALARGCEVTVVERDDVGSSLRTWGPTRFFSPLAMNVTPLMREVLGADLPDDDALLTGPEFVDRVLQPLAERAPLHGHIRTQTRVVAVGRRGMTKGDYAGHPLRAERPFRVVVEAQAGAPVPPPEGGAPAPVGRQAPSPAVLEAEVILDASGGYLVPNHFGLGGLPLHARALRTLGALHAAREELRGKHLVLIGHGHSAANALAMLADNGTRVTWAVRSPNRRPCTEVANDPLPERQRVVAAANDLAESPPSWLVVQRRASVEAIEGDVVTLTGNRRVEGVDVIAAFTGYRPDNAPISELAIEVSPVTDGGARLYRAVANVTDCLAVPRLSPADLATGEPNYWFVGSRIYGRAPTFLLQTGYQQLDTILATI
jgi:hypothetical protein